VIVVVVGGKLQGLETLYLARKAGFTTILIDKRAEAVARNCCDIFVQHEFGPQAQAPELPGPLPDCIIPALEDPVALAAAKAWAEHLNVPFTFDLQAFSCSSSKLTSNHLFHTLNLPVPEAWPGCSFPVVAKPDSASGSHGVQIFHNDQVQRLQELARQGTHVIQKYLSGPSYSIEVIGQPGNYQALQVTDLGMDEDYDCCQVTAPSNLPAGAAYELAVMAKRIAAKLNLTGIMDLEVILHQEKLYILEIDARIPSQTPMAVYWSTGINMIALLVQLFCDGQLEPEAPAQPVQHVVVEHVKVNSGGLSVLGEHIMTGQGPLELQKGFHGADEAITSDLHRAEWVATLIFTACSAARVDAKRAACHDQLIRQYCCGNMLL